MTVQHPYIRPWHAYLGATDRRYVERRIQRAADDNAPHDAIYDRNLTATGFAGQHGRDYVWACLSELDSEHDFRRYLQGRASA